MPFQNKFDVYMTERMYIRMTPEQKSRLQSVTFNCDIVNSDFWRGFMLAGADVILQEQKGAISPEELKMQLSDRLVEFVLKSGVLKAEDEPKEP